MTQRALQIKLYNYDKTKKIFTTNLIHLYYGMINEKWEIILLTGKANSGSLKYKKVKKNYLQLLNGS
jgi:hypothetical protein